MICAMYIRVSTDDQLEFSPDAQKRALTEYAKKNGYQIDDRYIFIDEGISGTSAKRRPSFMRMIATAKQKPKPFDAILVHKFDRFARSREDSVVYKSLLRKECGIKVISITEQMEDDKFSVILEAMLEAMAEYYSLNLSDEVMKGMTEKASRGQVQHPATFGYKTVNGKYEINEDQAEIVRLVFNKFVNEDMHCSNICRLINAMGIKNIRGNDWDIRGIKRMLRNPAYIGTLRWNYIGRDKNYKSWVKDESEWIVVENAHESIISKEMFDEANSRLNMQSLNRSNKRPPTYEIKHYLSGLLRCPSCNNTLIYSHLKEPKNDFFQCGGYRKGKCNTSSSIITPKIEKSFIDGLIKYKYLFDNDKYEKVNISFVQKDTSVKKILEVKLLEIKKKYDTAKRAYLAGIDSLEEYGESKKMIKKEEEEIIKQLNNCIDEKEAPKAISEKIQSFLSIANDNSVPVKVKNELLKSFITEVYVDKLNDKLDINFYYHS